MSRSIKAKTGTYQKDGETKNRYTDIGVILSNQNGDYILLNPGVSLAGILAQQNATNNEPRTNVMCSVFDNDNRQQAPQRQAPQQQNSAPSDFDVGTIPF